jgi:hypothetical protein
MNYKLQENQELLEILQKKLGSFVSKKEKQIKLAMKGYLAYYGINRNKLEWRFKGSEELRTEEKTETEIDSDNSQIKKIIRGVSDKTFENLYNFEYPNSKLAKLKTNELLLETERDFDFRVQVEKQSFTTSIVYGILKNQLKSEDFKKTLIKAKTFAAKKGVGFLHIDYIDCYKEDNKNGVKINALDSDSVLVDPNSERPLEGFIIRKYNYAELIERYPCVKDYFDKKKDKSKYSKLKSKGDELMSGSGFPYNRAEQIVEAYEANHLNSIDKKFYDIKDSNYNGYSKKCDKYFYNIFNGDISKKTNYKVTEYYNIPEKFYAIYIDDYVMYEGDLPDWVDQMPITPIYVNREKTDYFGYPMALMFESYQDKHDYLELQQKFLEKMLGKTTLVINDNSLNPEYHEDGQINIVDSSPITTIHMNQIFGDKDKGSGIAPLNFNNGAYGVIQSEKANNLNQLNTDYTSIRSMALGSDPSRSETTIEVDPLAKSIITDIGLQLSDFARLLLKYKFAEYKEFKNGDVIETDIEKRRVYISEKEADKKSLIEKHIKEMQNNRDKEVKKEIQKIEVSPEAGSMQAEIIKTIKDAEIQKFIQAANIGVPNQEVLAQMEKDNEINQKVSEIYQKEGAGLLKQRITLMAENNIPRVENKNIYFAEEDLDVVMGMEKEFEFSFKETTKEKALRLSSMVASLKPFEGMTDMVLNVKNMVAEIVLSHGFNPVELMIDRPYDPDAVFRTRNTKDMINIQVDSETLKAPYMSKVLNEKITVDDLLANREKVERMKLALKIEEIDATNASKAKANLIIKDVEDQKATNQPPTNPNIINNAPELQPTTTPDL